MSYSQAPDKKAPYKKASCKKVPYKIGMLNSQAIKP